MSRSRRFRWKMVAFIWSLLLNAIVVVNAASNNRYIATKGIKRLSGIHLRIAVYHEPPIFSIIRDPKNASNVRYVGFPKDMFDMLSNSLNFTYSFVEVTSAMVTEKGTIDEALNDQLIQNNADINGRLISPTAERLVYMDFTVYISVFQFALIQPMPQIHNRFLAPIKPFQSTVWLLIFVSLAATAIALAFTNIMAKPTGHKRRNKPKTKISTISKNTFVAFSVLMSQGEHLHLNKLSFRIVAGSWCLIAVVLVYAYNSTLISYIYLPVYNPVVHTLEDLVTRKTLRIAVAKGGIYADIIMNAKTGILKTLGDSLRRNPQDLLLALPGELNRVLKSGCCAYFEVMRLGEVLVYRSMVENNRQCQLTISKPLDYSQVWMFGAAKNLLYLPTINKEIQRLRQNGLMARFATPYSRSIDKCLAIKGDRPKNSKLTLYDLASAFIVLGLGYSFSFLAFIVELLMFRRCTMSSPKEKPVEMTRS